MRLLRWALLGLAVGALAAFALGLLSPRRGAAAYRPPRSAPDHRAVLPG